jgi:hypothetical protein
MLFILTTIFMVQPQSFHRLFLVFAVAPLAVIGVVLALLPSGAPLGFVAILGVLVLIGILIRNSVILIVQIEHLKEAGRPAWDAWLRLRHQHNQRHFAGYSNSLALCKDTAMRATVSKPSIQSSQRMSPLRVWTENSGL